ncbi:hypothetical protein Tco_0675814 [Tanacetum coccineum]
MQQVDGDYRYSVRAWCSELVIADKGRIAHLWWVGEVRGVGGGVGIAVGLEAIGLGSSSFGTLVETSMDGPAGLAEQVMDNSVQVDKHNPNCWTGPSMEA